MSHVTGCNFIITVIIFVNCCCTNHRANGGQNEALYESSNMYQLPNYFEWEFSTNSCRALDPSFSNCSPDHSGNATSTYPIHDINKFYSLGLPSWYVDGILRQAQENLFWEKCYIYCKHNDQLKQCNKFISIFGTDFKQRWYGTFFGRRFAIFNDTGDQRFDTMLVGAVQNGIYEKSQISSDVAMLASFAFFLMFPFYLVTIVVNSMVLHRMLNKSKNSSSFVFFVSILMLNAVTYILAMSIFIPFGFVYFWPLCMMYQQSIYNPYGYKPNFPSDQQLFLHKVLSSTQVLENCFQVLLITDIYLAVAKPQWHQKHCGKRRAIVVSVAIATTNLSLFPFLNVDAAEGYGSPYLSLFYYIGRYLLNDYDSMVWFIVFGTLHTIFLALAQIIQIVLSILLLLKVNEISGDKLDKNSSSAAWTKLYKLVLAVVLTNVVTSLPYLFNAILEILKLYVYHYTGRTDTYYAVLEFSGKNAYKIIEYFLATLVISPLNGCITFYLHCILCAPYRRNLVQLLHSFVPEKVVQFYQQYVKAAAKKDIVKDLREENGKDLMNNSSINYTSTKKLKPVTPVPSPFFSERQLEGQGLSEMRVEDTDD